MNEVDAGNNLHAARLYGRGDRTGFEGLEYRKQGVRKRLPRRSAYRRPAPTQSPKVENPPSGGACVRVHGELDERNLHPVYRNQEGDISDWIGQPDL